MKIDKFKVYIFLYRNMEKCVKQSAYKLKNTIFDRTV